MSLPSPPSGRSLVYVHQFHDNGPDGVEWTLESRTLRDGSTTVASCRGRTQTVPFADAQPLRALAEQTITQDGVTFTTAYSYSSSNFADYLQPSTITQVGQQSLDDTRDEPDLRLRLHLELHPAEGGVLDGHGRQRGVRTGASTTTTGPGSSRRRRRWDGRRRFPATVLAIWRA